MKRSRQESFRRYVMFVIALFVIAFGTSLSIRANLGSSPISCPPYVLSLVPGIGLTMGVLVFCMHATLIMVQIAILRRRYQPFQLLQLAVGVLFGFYTDLTMWLTGYLQIMSNTPLGYSLRLVELLCGGAILAYGISMEVRCDVLMLATEGTQVVISRVLDKDFGRVKMVTDTLLVVVGVILSFVFFGHWNWELIGPGTLISMFYVGFMVRVFSPHLGWLDAVLLVGHEATAAETEEREEEEEEEEGRTPWVITISREYGCGGHAIGKILADRLGVPLYDRQLIDETAEKLGLNQAVVARSDQNISNAQLWEAIFTDHSIPASMNPSQDDAIFVTQSRIIRRLADKRACIIIGRLANWVLRDDKHALKVFVCSDADDAARAIATNEHLTLDEARERYEAVNRARANHYFKYTGQRWQDSHGYDLVVNTAKIDSQHAADLILKTVESIKKG